MVVFGEVALAVVFFLLFIPLFAALVTLDGGDEGGALLRLKESFDPSLLECLLKSQFLPSKST